MWKLLGLLTREPNHSDEPLTGGAAWLAFIVGTLIICALIFATIKGLSQMPPLNQ